MNGLVELPADVAECLSRHRGSLELKGLGPVTEEAAMALARRGHCLYLLSGITELTPQAARGIAKFKDPLCLQGLVTLSLTAAKALAAHDDSLDLSGLTSVLVPVAKALAQHRGPVALNGVVSLSDEAAEALSTHSAVLRLDGLTELTPAAARSLSKHSAPLHLNGLRDLSPEVASEMVSHTGLLSLDGLVELPLPTAHHLAQHGGALTLDGLNVLSESVAQELKRYRGWISMKRLISLESAIAESVVESVGPTIQIGDVDERPSKATPKLGAIRDAEYWHLFTTEWSESPYHQGKDEYVLVRSLSRRLWALGIRIDRNRGLRACAWTFTSTDLPRELVGERLLTEWVANTTRPIEFICESGDLPSVLSALDS